MATKLYYAPGACSLASHIVLEEVGIEYETQRLNLQEGDQRKPEYLALNPRGRVPTLVVDGKVLTENLAIMVYVAGGYPKAGLWPAQTWEQARLLSMLTWFSNTVHPTYGHIVRPERYAEEQEARDAIKEKARESYAHYLREIDELIDNKKWVMGRQYTPADAYALVFYRWGNRQGFPVRMLKSYCGLVERMLERRAVKKVMADEGITLD